MVKLAEDRIWEAEQSLLPAKDRKCYFCRDNKADWLYIDKHNKLVAICVWCQGYSMPTAEVVKCTL